jgi:hypothetical protein
VQSGTNISSPRTHILQPLGVSFDGEAWVTNTNFNKQLIRVHPSSKLAVVAMYPSNHLRLFYQTEDHNIHEHVYTPEAGWVHQAVIISAITGSSIAVAAYPCRDELSLFYQDVDCSIRQLTKTNEDTYVEGRIFIYLFFITVTNIVN